MKDLNLEQLEKSPKLTAHAFRVLAAIQNLIENLEDPEVFVEMLKNIARSHGDTGVTKKNFEVSFKLYISKVYRKITKYHSLNTDLKQCEQVRVKKWQKIFNNR